MTAVITSDLEEVSGLSVIETPPPDWKRNVALFVTGRQATAFGSMMVQLAVLWHLARATESGWVMTLAIVFGLGPQAVMSLVSGVVADRIPQKLLILGSDALIAVVSLGLGLALAAGIEGLWFILIASALRSVFAGLQGPAFASVLPRIAPESQLMRINGLNETLGAAFWLASPILVGILMSTVGLPAVMFFDVATAVVGVALLSLVPMSGVPAANSERTGVLADLLGGFRYVASNRPVKWLFALFGGAGFFVDIPVYLAVLQVVRTFGGETWMLSGVEMAAAGGFAVGGAVIAAVAMRIKRNRTLIVVGTMLATGFAAALLGLAPNIWLLFVLCFAIFFTCAAWWTSVFTFLQESVPEEIRGRVFGIQEFVMAACAPLAFLAAGPLADRFAVESVIAGSGLLLITWVGGVAAFPPARRALAAFATAP